MDIDHRGIPRREPALPTQHRAATRKPPSPAIPRTPGVALQDQPPKRLARKGLDQRSNPERAATTQCLNRPDRGAMPPESWCNAARIVVQCHRNRGAMSPESWCNVTGFCSDESDARLCEAIKNDDDLAERAPEPGEFAYDKAVSTFADSGIIALHVGESRSVRRAGGAFPWPVLAPLPR